MTRPDCEHCEELEERLAAAEARVREVEGQRDMYKSAHIMEQELREDYGAARDAALARADRLEKALREIIGITTDNAVADVAVAALAAQDAKGDP